MDPGVYIPSVARWAEVVPDWLRKRRDEVVGPRGDRSGHDPTEDIHGYYRNRPEARQVAR